jgi:hypothetical protein
VFENRALTAIFGPKGDDVTGDWRKSHMKELHFTPNITRVVKSRKERWVGHVERMGEARCAYRALVKII